MKLINEIFRGAMVWTILRYPPYGKVCFCILNPPALRMRHSDGPLSNWNVTYIILGNKVLTHSSGDSEGCKS